MGDKSVTVFCYHVTLVGGTICYYLVVPPRSATNWCVHSGDVLRGRERGREVALPKAPQTPYLDNKYNLE